MDVVPAPGGWRAVCAECGAMTLTADARDGWLFLLDHPCPSLLPDQRQPAEVELPTDDARSLSSESDAR